MNQDEIDKAFLDLALARKQVRQARRAFAGSPEGQFTRVMLGAMQQYQKARVEGVSREDAIKGIEGELRAAWPMKTSKFAPACALCDDTGWREHTCTDQMRCGRDRCQKDPSFEHPYVASCGCARGERHRTKTFTPREAAATVGRTQKPKKGFTRFGS